MLLDFCFIGPKSMTKKTLKLKREDNLQQIAYVHASMKNSMSDYSGVTDLKGHCMIQE